jgi:hypothetical protein
VAATDVMMFLIHCNWAKHIYMPDLSPIFSNSLAAGVALLLLLLL